VPELPVLSPVDVSKTQEGWTCVPLTVEEVLSEGEHLAYYVARTLNYIEGIP
jgi:hypothetical protein